MWILTDVGAPAATGSIDSLALEEALSQADHPALGHTAVARAPSQGHRPLIHLLESHGAEVPWASWPSERPAQRKRGPGREEPDPLLEVVAGAGFEPATSGL